jgi:hypothetical protein
VDQGNQLTFFHLLRKVKTIRQQLTFSCDAITSPKTSMELINRLSLVFCIAFPCPNNDDVLSQPLGACTRSNCLATVKPAYLRRSAVTEVTFT